MVETWVGQCCGWLLCPLWADSVKISCGKQARVWQQMIGISLMCVDLRRRSGWKTVKNWRFLPFLTVFDSFQLLRLRKSIHINEIPIIFCHTLACLPHEILAESAQRGPSNRPQYWPTRVSTMACYWEYMKYWLYFEPWFLGVASSWNIKFYT